MKKVAFGFNKKRHGNFEDDMDDLERRKHERMREREEMMDEQELAKHLLNGGGKRARQALMLKDLAEEE